VTKNFVIKYDVVIKESSKIANDLTKIVKRTFTSYYDLSKHKIWDCVGEKM